MDEQLKLAVEFAKDLSEQIITLSTGIVAITITFAKEFDGGKGRDLRWVRAGWVLYVVSIIFGVVSLMALTGQLATRAPLNEIGPSAKWPAAFQIFAFLGATICLIWYGYRTLKRRAEGKLPNSTTGTGPGDGRRPKRR